MERTRLLPGVAGSQRTGRGVNISRTRSYRRRPLASPTRLAIQLDPLVVVLAQRQVVLVLLDHLVALLSLADPGGEEHVERRAVVAQRAPLAVRDHAPVGGNEQRLAEVRDRLHDVDVAA